LRKSQKRLASPNVGKKVAAGEGEQKGRGRGGEENEAITAMKSRKRGERGSHPKKF